MCCSKIFFVLSIMFLCSASCGCSLKRTPLSVIEPVYSYARDPFVKISPFSKSKSTAIAGVK